MRRPRAGTWTWSGAGVGALVLATAVCIAGAAVAFAFPDPAIPAPDADRAIDVPAQGDLDPPAGDQTVIQLLSGIDFVPTKGVLDAALGGSPEATLGAIARNGSPIGDPGVRIRAYRALALYQTTSAETDLAAAVGQHGGGGDAMDNLYLRAAMDSLATVASAGGVCPQAKLDDITPHLTHPSRDVRAAAARALSTCGSPAAIDILRARLMVEPEEQVKVAISKAIRDLDGS